MEYRRCRPRDASRSDWRIPCHCLHRPVDASARIYECRRTQRRAPHRPRRLGTLFPHRNTLPGIDHRLWKSEKYRIFANVPANPPPREMLYEICLRIGIAILEYAAGTRMFPVSCMLQTRAIDGAILYARKRNTLRREYTRPFTIKLPIILGNATVLSCCNKSLYAILFC